MNFTALRSNGYNLPGQLFSGQLNNAGISWKGKDGNMSFDQLKQQIYENDFTTLNVLKGHVVNNESIFMFPQVKNIVVL